MKVLVLGSGVIGVTTAWYLQRAGHEVTVVDRQAEVGLETSHANGGQVSWGAGTPWAAPGIPLKALKWMLRPHSPLVLRPRLDPAMWTWLFKMLANCTSERYVINKERMVRLSRYSHECLMALRNETGIRYDEHMTGILELFRTKKELDDAARDARMLSRWGVDCRLLDRAGCVAHEPALRASQEKIVGGLHFPGDESGDCFQFTQSLANLAKSQGVTFSLNTHIERLEADGDCLIRVITGEGELKADAYVIACGSYTPLLLRPLGIRLPIYPVKGYSVTLPLMDAKAAPAGSVTDVTYKVVITRLGDKLRGAGTAELAGYDLSLRSSRLAIISHVLADLFPGAGNQVDAQNWCGLRPMTPDNPPILGATPCKNLFINTGHGTLGWTMACGSGKILADIVSGRSVDIDLKGLTLARFS
ncbi:MAG: D-amino acid dehydrogenase [Sulfuricaulis sp.]|uniref:D-amino acid dehydrogenase n=1 Tax=Sulfuricaulis sp. TaxID=2003553 RepID=UPI0025D53AF7|nr:D-amino acid dehydrogenase [Sulfuricaulis sp.]MCR4346901.1 D-amino acid dehydrogenase [Sulfuricaulis sp.]